MYAIRKSFDDLPEKIIVPPELIHKKGEIIIMVDDYSEKKDKKFLKDFFGIMADFPERSPQGDYEKREPL